MGWYLAVLRKYTRLRGRASRAEYWWFILFHFLAIALLLVIDTSILGSSGTQMIPLTWIYLLGTYIPSLAVSVRRLHDTGKSGWWYLISLIPLGVLVLIILCLAESDSGTNKYGANPQPNNI